MEWVEYSVSEAEKGDKNYPDILAILLQPPKQIFYRGKLSKGILVKSIALVGSRRMTRYGATVIDKFVSAFVSAGITTVSGYMYGVDTEVHSKTVEYGGKTIAVMGGGINKPYPPENDELYTKILQNGGVVLSEYKPEQKPQLWAFPQRNRIIAALATLGVLVIEAGESSGSLITVHFAKKLKKKIFAVPGPITSSVSAGTNMLIKKGIGEMVTGPEDIVRVKEQESGRVKVNTELNSFENEIYKLLKREEMSVDEIAVALKKDMVEVSTIVSMMALRGLISEAGGKYFVI
jgi:DNA processing protein